MCFCPVCKEVNTCTGELTAHDDLLVIGSGPAGQKAAIQAAKLGNKVGIIEREEVIGGVYIITGTIPSQSLRDAVVHPTGFCHRGLSGASSRVKPDSTMEDVVFLVSHQIVTCWHALY